MASLTQRLRLKAHTLADRYRIQDYADNWTALDKYPGTYTCTSTTRPTDWTSNQAGMFIFETDTKRRWLWDGTAFILIDPRGSVARAERMADISTTATTYSTVIATAAATYTTRRHLVIAEASGVYSTQGLTGMALFRDGTLIQEWEQQGWTGAGPDTRPRPLSMVTSDQWAGGSAVYSLQFRAVVGFGGTSTVLGATNKPIAIHVVEV